MLPGTYIRTEEIKRKNREATRQQWQDPEKRGKLIEGMNKFEVREKRRKLIIKSWQNLERRKKYSEKRKGKNNPFYGRTHTEKTKIKISKASKGKNNPMYGKKLSDEQRKKIKIAWQNGCYDGVFPISYKS